MSDIFSQLNEQKIKCKQKKWEKSVSLKKAKIDKNIEVEIKKNRIKSAEGKVTNGNGQMIINDKNVEGNKWIKIEDNLREQGKKECTIETMEIYKTI